MGVDLLETGVEPANVAIAILDMKALLRSDYLHNVLHVVGGVLVLDDLDLVSLRFEVYLFLHFIK